MSQIRNGLTCAQYRCHSKFLRAPSKEFTAPSSGTSTRGAQGQVCGRRGQRDDAQRAGGAVCGDRDAQLGGRGRRAQHQLALLPPAPARQGAHALSAPGCVRRRAPLSFRPYPLSRMLADAAQIFSVDSARALFELMPSLCLTQALHANDGTGCQCELCQCCPRLLLNQQSCGLYVTISILARLFYCSCGLCDTRYVPSPCSVQGCVSERCG